VGGGGGGLGVGVWGGVGGVWGVFGWGGGGGGFLEPPGARERQKTIGIPSHGSKLAMVWGGKRGERGIRIIIGKRERTLVL